MSVIQTIRDKAAWIIIAAIALALIAFIVQDALQGGGGGLFSGNATTLGKVNGTTIDAISFEQRYKTIETNYQNANYPLTEQLRQQIRDEIWNEYINDAVFTKEINKLGFGPIGKDERGDILYGSNPPQQLRQQFTDPKTGAFDAQAAYQAISSLKKNTPQYNYVWGELVPALEKQRLREKFLTLLANSAYVPKWLLEKTNTENSQRSSISYVNVPYNTISDSLVKVTDDDIRKYVDEHKELFKQEKAAGIEYVLFDAAPTKADSTAIFNDLAGKKEAMSTADAAGIDAFLTTNNSETPYFDGYVSKTNLKVGNADTIQTLADGAVYGPYLDAGNYVVAKMIGKRTLPDSVRSRHILIKIADKQEGQKRTDSAAKKLIDSIVTAINAGANFDSMVVNFSDDAGSKDKGGVYEFSSLQFGNLSKEFAETIFYGTVGEKKTVKVENESYSGYHYIEVLGQKKFEPAYKVAYLSRRILPSDETINHASSQASQFLGESRTKKEFDENVKKKNLNKFPAMDIKPTDYMITGVGESRELVRWMFNDAKMGTVSDRPFQVGEKYIVPVLTNKYEKGTMPVERARPLVEYKIRNQKKADEIIKKIGSANTLEAVSKAVNQPVLKADSILFTSPFVPNVGNELKLIGASFNKEYQSKISPAIAGEIGVFVIKIDNISAVPNPNFDVKQQQQSLIQQQRSMSQYRIVDILKKTADIKDNRVTFF